MLSDSAMSEVTPNFKMLFHGFYQKQGVFLVKDFVRTFSQKKNCRKVIAIEL